MIRIVASALAALVVGAAPAFAQVTYAPELFAPRVVTIVGSPRVVVPEVTSLPRTRYLARQVLVAHTHYVHRTVLVARTRYVRRTLDVPVTTYVTRPAAVVYPAAGFATIYPGTGLVGPTWVPPGTTYACQLGTVGCDSSVVGPMAF